MFGQARWPVTGVIGPWTGQILAVLASRMALDQMLVDCGSVQKTSRNHKSN